VREKRVELFSEPEENEDRGRRRETNVWSGKSMDRKETGRAFYIKVGRKTKRARHMLLATGRSAAVRQERENHSRTPQS
jgi:hypothetical protein